MSFDPDDDYWHRQGGTGARVSTRTGPGPVPMTGPNATGARFLGGLVLSVPAAALTASVLGTVLMGAGLLVLPADFLPEPEEVGRSGVDAGAFLLIAALSLLFTVPGAVILALAMAFRWILWRDVPLALYAILGFFAGYAIWPGALVWSSMGVETALKLDPESLLRSADPRALIAACWFSGPAGAVAAWVGAAVTRRRVAG